jgi:aspartyl-tRNA(Asn)/glutamyl-tRNA(Gln) amidotransferase subunit A
MVFMAMGSDTGGSIRIPGSFCGTAGIKPTFGRVSRYGAMPLGFTLDHMGPLTRTVRDSALTLQVLAGYDERDDTTSRLPVDDYLPAPEVSIRDVRIGIPQNFYFERVSPEVEASVRSMAQVAEGLGAKLVPITVPDIPAMNAVARIILLAEAAAALAPHVHRRSEIGSDVLTLLDQGRLIAAPDYVNAQRLRRIFQQRFDALWRDVDCILAPATPTTAPRIGQTEVELDGIVEDVRVATTRMVRAINLLRLPALSLPCGISAEGLPIGAQIIGKAFDEKLLFRVVAALEDALPKLGPPPICRT